MKLYGTIELTESSPAQSFTEPLTLAQVRKFIKVEQSSPADEELDALLSSFITAAREVAEIQQGRDLILKQYDLRMDSLLENEIYLREPLQSIDLFQYTDSNGGTTTLTENTDYIVDANRSCVMPPYGLSWPAFEAHPSSAVLIRFTSGFASTHPFWSNAGQRILQGMRFLIAAWHDGRLPWRETGNSGSIPEYPYAVTSLFDFGAKRQVH